MNEVKLRKSRQWLVIGCLLIATVIWLSLTPGPAKVLRFDHSDKLAHLLAYGLLMGWFGQIYHRPWLRLGHAFSFTLLGVVLEFAQHLGGQRDFDVADMLANATGVVLALIVLRLGAGGVLLWVERRVMGLAPTGRESNEST